MNLAVLVVYVYVLLTKHVNCPTSVVDGETLLLRPYKVGVSIQARKFFNDMCVYWNLVCNRMYCFVTNDE